MSARRISLGILVAGAACLAGRWLDAAEATRPNIVVVLADDLGYGDLHCYNPQRGKIPTPNLDRLASQGMRFTDAHSSSGVCSPSRYTLLTGRYHWRTRLQTAIVDVFGEPLIAPDRLTIASLARQRGYRTAAIGKWHLGWDWPIEPSQRPFIQGVSQPGKVEDAPLATAEHRAVWREVFSKPIGGGPTTRGFDHYFGTDVPNWPPYCFIEDDRTVGIPTQFLPSENFQHHLATLQGPAIEGWKLNEILPALADRAVAFIMESAKSTEPFLLYLPLTSPHTPLAVNEPWRGKSGLNTYADFVMETDAAVGRVLEAIDKSGAAERTLVVFTSDNGYAPYIGVADLEGKGHYPSGPLRGYKGDAWEGGHRVPFVVRWPGVVQSGSVCHQLVHHADLMATLAEILNVKLPDNAAEDSFSLLPLLRGEDRAVREHAVSCAVNGMPALRSGPWKLILGPGGGGFLRGHETQGVQLYNLAEDLGETNNLAAKEPGRVAAMQALMEELIGNGRSTPGAKQKNDVEVRRFPREPVRPHTPAKTGGVAKGSELFSAKAGEAK